MRLIIMGRDECGTEFRVTDHVYASHNAANNDLLEAREDYPEAQSIWVEEYKDKYYYMAQQADRHPDDEYEDMYR